MSRDFYFIQNLSNPGDFLELSGGCPVQSVHE